MAKSWFHRPVELEQPVNTRAVVGSTLVAASMMVVLAWAEVSLDQYARYASGRSGASHMAEGKLRRS